MVKSRTNLFHSPDRVSLIKRSFLADKGERSAILQPHVMIDRLLTMGEEWGSSQPFPFLVISTENWPSLFGMVEGRELLSPSSLHYAPASRGARP
jgi:hypothetical protein